MKKCIVVALLVLVLSMLVGCGCEHVWEKDIEESVTPTCISAGKTVMVCSECGEIEITELPVAETHDWTKATCTTPKACDVCGITEGSTLEHNWEEATCEVPETCSECGKTNGRAIGHVSGAWEYEDDVVSATRTSTKYCVVCDKELDVKTATISRLHNGKTFLFTPSEFEKRLGQELIELYNSGVDHTLWAISLEDGGEFVCTVNSGIDTVGVFSFHDSGHNSVSAMDKDKQCIASMVGLAEFDEDTLAALTWTLLKTCDPTLSERDITNISSELIEDALVTKNGITYGFAPMDDEYVLIAVKVE